MSDENPSLVGLRCSPGHIYESKEWTLDVQDRVSKFSLDHLQSRTIPERDLGVLDGLPQEVLSEILLSLSLRELLDFTHVNRRALQVVNSIPQWKPVLKHGNAAIRGLLTTEIGSIVTLLDLHEAMCTSRCASCGDFGGYIYLFTCTRVCFSCFSNNEKYFPLTTAQAARRFGVARNVMADLPTMRSVRGRYSVLGTVMSKRLTLVDPEHARAKALPFHASEQAMEALVHETASKKDQAHKVQWAAWIASGRREKPPRSSPNAYPAKYNHHGPERFMAVVRAPCIDAMGTAATWGFRCIGCYKNHNYRQKEKRHDMESFQDHLLRLGKIDPETALHVQPPG